MLPPTTQPAPGWYADPQQYGAERYWNGAAWSEHRRTAVPAAVPLAVVVPAPGNGQAVAALVCGIVGAVFGLVPWTFWLAWILGVIAIVFGAIGRRRADRDPAAGKRSTATAGLILGIVAIALGVVGLIILVNVIDHATTTINDIQSCFQNPDQLHCD